MLRFEPCGASLALPGLTPQAPGHRHVPVWLPLCLVWTSKSHCSSFCAAARWILDMTHYLASSGTVGGSCHGHQPTPAQSLWDAAHCLHPKLQGHQGMTTPCKEISGPVGAVMRMSLLLSFIPLDSSDFPGWGSVQLGPVHQNPDTAFLLDCPMSRKNYGSTCSR